MSGRKKVIRYSLAFKQKVVQEIESGEKTISEARRIYDIKGGGTIHYWIRQFGKNHLIAKIVRVEMSGEKDRVKALEREKQRLESALAQAHLKILSLETLIKKVERDYPIDVKKNIDGKASKK